MLTLQLRLHRYKTSRIINHLLSFLIIQFCLFTQATLVSAQEIIDLEDVPVSNDFNVGPTRYRLSLNPGEESYSNIQITNRMGQETGFIIEIEDFTSQEDADKYTKFLGSEKSQFSSKEWFEPQVDSFVLQHGQKIKIPIKVDVPLTAEPGDHYSAVFIKTTCSKKKVGSISLSSRVGVLFLINVNGQTNKSGGLNYFKNTSSLYTSPEATFEIEYQNTGNVHLNPVGKITITNLLNKKSEVLSIDDWIILRDSTRRKEIDWKPVRAIGAFKAVLDLNNGFSDSNYLETVYFYILPKKEILVTSLILIFIFLFANFFIKKYEIRKKK